MKTIERGVQPKHFADILSGKKNFEIRLAYIDYQSGDMLVIKEEKEGSQEFTGRKIKTKITFVQNTKETAKYYKKEDIEELGLDIVAFEIIK